MALVIDSYHFQILHLPLNQGIEFHSSLQRVQLSANCLPLWDNAPETVRQSIGKAFDAMTFLCKRLVVALDGLSLAEATSAACVPTFGSVLGVTHLDLCSILQRISMGATFLKIALAASIASSAVTCCLILFWAGIRQTLMVRRIAFVAACAAPFMLTVALALERMTAGDIPANALSQFFLGISFDTNLPTISMHTGYIAYTMALLCGLSTLAVVA